MLLLRERPRQPPALERAVCRFWRERAASLPALQCDDGTSLRVLYPGRPSAAAGPDFRDAVLQRPSGEVLRGDVEVHLRRGGWEAHGHAGDRRYNGVVLHVVLHPDGPGMTPITLASGARVPTATLFPRTLSQKTHSRATHRPLPLASLPTGRLEGLLDRAGDARFAQKSRRFRNALLESDPDQGVYEALMTALGYGGNSEPFLRLAQGFPLRAVARTVTGVLQGDRRAALEAALLHAGGLAKPGDPRANAVAAAVPAVVSPGDWRLFRVRPSNHPALRVRGMAALLDRAWNTGLVAWAVDMVEQGCVTAVMKGLTASDASGTGQQALIGGSRAGDLAVNAALPFVHAWGKAAGDPDVSAKALALYRAWPPLQENAVTAEAGRVLHLSSLAECDRVAGFKKTARRQQGLLHLYRRYLGRHTA